LAVGRGRWEGGREGRWILREIPPKHALLSKTGLFQRRGRILSPNLSMGDRIHEQCSMEPPRCPGRRKNPYSGWHNTYAFSDEINFENFKKVVKKLKEPL
jgi:hypothetical protein